MGYDDSLWASDAIFESLFSYTTEDVALMKTMGGLYVYVHFSNRESSLHCPGNRLR